MRVLLSLTEKCNLRCTYCYYNESQNERCADMSDEVREASLRYILDKTIEFKHDYLSITFFGGEPLLKFDAIQKSVSFLKNLVQSRFSELPKGFALVFATLTTVGTVVLLARPIGRRGIARILALMLVAIQVASLTALFRHTGMAALYGAIRGVSMP